MFLLAFDIVDECRQSSFQIRLGDARECLLRAQPNLKIWIVQSRFQGIRGFVSAPHKFARGRFPSPAWIRGIDHRVDPHYPGVRDLSVSPSAKLAGEKAGVSDAPIAVAELCASYTHEELLLRDALGLGDETLINPSGGALVSNPPMVAGLTRIGEAFRQIHHHGRRRTLGHASSGPCLQQNLVCVLEGE